MAPNRLRGRQRNVTGAGKSINRRGAGLGTGPVGSQGGYSGRPGGGSHRPSSGNSFGGGRRPSGGNVTRSGGGGMMKFIIIALVLLLGGGSGVGSILSDDSMEYTSTAVDNTSEQSITGQSTSDFLNSLYGNLGGGNVSAGWNNGNMVFL